MIVDPDFFDHWRTRMLVDALSKDEMAPMYVMRIWAHCQNRKATAFDMPSNGLKALCRYAGDAMTLESALVDAGFICRDGSSVSVAGWAEHNSKLIANWTNGPKGGRPKATSEEPKDNPTITQLKPTETQSEPIGEEEIGEEVSDPNGSVVASDAGRPACPHQQIIALYHEVLPMCPQVRDWTPARATQLRARWNEDEKRQSLAYWKQFFEYVGQCDFLVGRAGKTPFFADLEWMTKSANFTKIREAKYENKRAA